MTDLTPDDLGYGDNYLDRPEASESGIITEMEHRRTRSMSNDHVFSEAVGEGEKKSKSRRLSTRMARNIKKQFKTDKGRPRSHSPPSSSQRNDSLGTSPEEEDPVLQRSATVAVEHLEPKKHKSKLKPVAKAAVSAAKKLTKKKPSGAKGKEEDHSSRASTPTDLQGSHSTISNNFMVGGKTPVNTPVNVTDIVDRTTFESVVQHLPPTLVEDGEEADDDEPILQNQAPAQEAPPALTSEVPANAAPTEDEALKLAEAMAMAVQKNPNKSQEEIRRMVYSQPEFKHLVPPGTIKPTAAPGSASSDSTTKLLKKNFSNIKKQFTSGAGTAQKKIMEMAETNLGSGITSFSFGMSTTKAPSAAAVASIEKAMDAESSASSGLSAPPPSVATIPEEPQAAAEAKLATEKPAVDVASTMAAVSEEMPAKPAPTHADPNAVPVPKPTPNKWQDLPITITDIVWKRRSGFGKYSADAWERRRFVLQGNVLSYYRAKSDSLEPIDDDTERADLNASLNMDKANASAKSNSTKQRMFDYMEQVVASAGLSAAAVADKSEEEKKSARGYMDLIKENAVICATLGHSGAPSPFCLSIKVGGETKWKLCFSSHRSQLQWMAAISDVIVRASVDMYNVKLLTKADPTNHDPTQAFQPTVYEPPPGGNDDQPSSDKSLRAQQKRDAEDEELMPQPSMQVSGKRLWIMEPYVIRPQSDEDDDESFCSSSSAEDEPGLILTNKAGGAELSDDRDVWSLPEKNLMLAAAIVNIAILYARNSNMSVQSFWTVVTVANIALYTFLESKPRPEAIAAGLNESASRRSPRKRRRNKRNIGASSGTHSGTAKGEGAAGSKSKKEKFKPTAGTSALRVEKPDDPNVNAKGEKFSKWCAVEGETLQVRSHGYATTKGKIPSPGTLYELSQCDIFESPARYPDMAPRVKLPKLSYEIDPNEEKTWKSPDHFVVSLSLPTDPPKLGASTTDGGGYTITMYFTMRKSTRDILKRVTADGYDPSSEEKPQDIQKWQVNAVRLFEEWCRRGTDDIKFLTRFKMVPNVVNAEEIGLPSWIGKYNGKPLLIKRPGQTGFFLPHPELSCIEFDISLHVFPYLAKQGICYLKDTLFKSILATVGFVIEGRDDDELPECLIGLVHLCQPDPANMMQASDFFSGTAPKSYEPDEKPLSQAPAGPATQPAQPVG